MGSIKKAKAEILAQIASDAIKSFGGLESASFRKITKDQISSFKESQASVQAAVRVLKYKNLKASADDESVAVESI